MQLPLFKTLCLIIGFGATSANAQQPDTARWLADFRQLKAEMASHYANLEWAVSERRMDLAALSAQTELALRSATADEGARRALQSFLAAFGDGHLEIRFPPPPIAGALNSPNPAVAPATVCARQGYFYRAPRIRIPFDRLPEFRRIDNGDARYFPLGILDLGGDVRVGVLRIASFEDNVFIDLCEQAATHLAISADSSCEARCADALERATSNLVTAALTRQIKAAEAQGIKAVVVDITHNGGGTNWVEAAARAFTPIALKAPRRGFARHPHHVQQLAEKIDALRRDVRTAQPAARPVLSAALGKLEAARRQAEQPCDRRPLWEGKQIGCSGVVTEPTLYATGVLDYARPGEVPTTSDCCTLFYPARYEFQEGVYRGKLFVLIDKETASAAEYFAALLKDNGAAELMGEATYGAGCGYTNGGIRTILKHSGARVLMPDCVRYRADGTNEVDGITPDYHVPWRSADSPFQRASKAARVIAGRMK